MSEAVERLITAEECEQFIKNVQERSPELAREARRRAVVLRAAAHGASTDVERELYEAVYAYEKVLTARNARATRASRTWPTIRTHGVIYAADRIVSRSKESLGYTALKEMGMQDFAFEAVVLRHPSHFSPEAIERSRARLSQI
jgi:hypothetical protein